MAEKVPNYVGLYRTTTGIYTIRIAAPKELRDNRKQVTKEIKRSLKTRDWETAKAAYHEFMRNINLEVVNCRAKPSSDPYPTDKFRLDVLEKAYDYFYQYSEYLIPQFLQQMNSPFDEGRDRAASMVFVKNYINDNIRALSVELNSNVYSTQSYQMVKNFLSGRYSLSPEQEEMALKTFAKAKLEALLHYQAINIDFEKTKESYSYRFPIIQEAIEHHKNYVASKLRKTSNNPKSTRLEDVFLRWSKEATGIAEKIAKVKSFITIFPEKDDLSQIKSSDICEWKEILTQLPAGYTLQKQFKGKSIEEIIEIADENDLSRMKKITINGYLVAFSVFYKWAKNKNLVGDNAVNPTKDMLYSKKETEAEANKPKAFTPESVKVFIDYCKKHYKTQVPEFFWSSMIMLHCGLRQKEASQLLISDIQTRDGLNYIRVQAGDSQTKSVKNKHSIRSIPIHQQLIDWGFLEYVEQRKKASSSTDRLFPSIIMNDKGNGERFSASKYHNKYFSKLLEDVNLSGQGYSSYSLRHTFTDFLRRAGYSDDDISYVVGHSSQNTMTSHYGDFHETPTRFLEKAKAMIDMVQY